MENHLIAIDVNGIAGTLTAKRLTDLDVQQTYGNSKIAVTNHPAGSLSLLDPDETGISSVVGYRDVTQTQDEEGNWGLFHVGIEENGVDWVLMNPPYSKARKGRVQATDPDETRRLRSKAKRRGYSMSNGAAGLASDFGGVSLIRLKPGGVFTQVLPMTAAYSGSWHNWREGMETHFENIVAVTNTGGDVHKSMSADTKMSEMLVVATKRKNNDHGRKPSQITCVNLYTAPTTLSEGYALGNEINRIVSGEYIANLNNLSYSRIETLFPGFPWYGVGNANNEISTVVSELMNGKCYQQDSLKLHSLDIEMRTLDAVCDIGPTNDLIGRPAGSEKRGAFIWYSTDSAWDEGGSKPKSLWSSNCKTQTQMVVEPTHFGDRIDCKLVKQINDKKSKWFIQQGVRWTSQALLTAKTSEDCHGGPAWNALQVDESIGRCIVLFYNSIFGALLMNAYGRSPQVGRARVAIKALSKMPCPDFGANSPGARRARNIAKAWFESLSQMKLHPFSHCFKDQNRHQIDNTVAEMLGLSPSDPDIQRMMRDYRLMFSSEPNVNGRQKEVLAALKRFRSGS